MNLATVEDARMREDLEALENADRFAALRATVASLPPVSPVVPTLMKALEEDELAWSELGGLVRTDPVLAARVLRVANSAALRGEAPAATIEAASRRLGTSGLNQIVLAAAVAFVADEDNVGYAVEGASMWRWCVAMAHVSAHLADRVPGLPTELAYTGGLMADVGKIVLGRQGDGPMLTDADADFDAVERARFGVDHATVSAWLLWRWGMPIGVVSGVRWHHLPGPRRGDLADVLHAAGHVVAAAFGVGVDALRYPVSPRVAERLLSGVAFDRAMLVVADTLRTYAAPPD